MEDHKEALRKWLRSKGFHPHDIASAIEYYGKQFPVPTDQEVLTVAETAHQTAVNSTIKKLSAEPVIVRYEKVSDIKWIQIGIGAGLALILDMLGVSGWLLQIIK